MSKKLSDRKVGNLVVLYWGGKDVWQCIVIQVSERDDKLLIDIMNKIQQDNEEVGGDDDSEEEEDTGMGEVDLDNGNAITEWNIFCDHCKA